MRSHSYDRNRLTCARSRAIYGILVEVVVKYPTLLLATIGNGGLGRHWPATFFRERATHSIRGIRIRARVTQGRHTRRQHQ